MSLSAHFPHKIALLQVALRAHKLKINDYLQDAAELAVISSLLVFLDSKDYRTPITKPRKVIGQYSMLGRTALYAKLAALEARNLIERFEGERAIRFTEQGVALLSAKEDNFVKSEKKEPRRFFRVGTSSFPKEVVPLLTRGISEKQLLSLMSEAKKAKVMIQDQMRKFGQILDRYEGKSLFLVFRSFLRNPDKYQQPAPAAAPAQAFNSVQLQQLSKLTSSDAKCIIRPEEQVRFHEGRWTYSAPELNGGAPQPMTAELLATLYGRIKEASLKAADEFGEIPIRKQNGDLLWDGEQADGRPLARLQADRSRSVTLSWGELYDSLPVACRHWSYLYPEVEVDQRVGRCFVRNGIRYMVELIEAGRALLWFDKGARRSTWVEAGQLDDASLQWCE
ncbi:hypothetical protein QU487_06795 [Crenobacter sp. SG2305]|uniref:hypothetical protein n=1 Tax=Crenobacter oryzisoli TaxID=3056844 RepID=UPI0025AA3643|nr:hypothetical protein [Crenobacter sp. SG2305]MDN0082462.1 hypothetical protein [Crenobacter sp. SG2305]